MRSPGTGVAVGLRRNQHAHRAVLLRILSILTIEFEYRVLPVPLKIECGSVLLRLVVEHQNDLALTSSAA